jgi:hypothetical protein
VKQLQFVDHVWQIYSQKVRGLGRIDAELCRERIDLVKTKYFLNLVAGNWLVFSRSDPGGKPAAYAARP